MQASYGFGATLDLDLLGIEVSEETLIPGLAVASSRAQPLAGMYRYSVKIWISLRCVLLDISLHFLESFVGHFDILVVLSLKT